MKDYQNAETWQDYLKVHPHAQDVVGNVKIWPKLWSPELNNQRDVIVYLPPSYDKTSKRFPVIYMHDGQNLFDGRTSFVGEDWKVDETMESLVREGIEAIVVGINHMGEQRLAEYNPFPAKFPARGDQYVRFLLETLKPIIDRDFRACSDRACTGIIGSSLGGLISLYAFFHPTQSFGFVGALSPAFWVGHGAIYEHVKKSPFISGKVYLDNGSHENSAQPMHELLRTRGYHDDQNLRYIHEDGGKHHEPAWARRLPGALRFLLK